jgi:putative Mg2+ transporter-C (MgtC) family protein
VIDVTNSWELEWDLVVRLLGAALLGGLVGLEREASEQQAGLRTHIAVALGAALFGAVSTLGFQEFDRPRAASTIQADVSRVASNVAVGIGFLGAGVIFRRGNVIKNLTTGASLWTVAAIGLAAGVGDMTMAALATAVLLVSLVVLRPVRTFVRRRFGEETHDVHITLSDRDAVSRVVETINSQDDVELCLLEIERDDDDRTVVVAQVRGRDEGAQATVVTLSALDVVREVREERGAT